VPYFRIYDGIGRSLISYKNEEYINFASYNYLGFNGNPEIAKSIQDAVKEYGTSVSASRTVSGERTIHRELEKKIAQFYQIEDSLAFVSGHATNVSAVSCLFSEKDLILYDALSHNSILEGVRLARSKALAYRHNDVSHIEALLKTHRHSYRNVLIISEGIFSMDGDIPDLPNLIEVKKKYRSFLMVDEAHSLGVLGDSGKGISEYYKLPASSIDIIMGTLSKTLCSCGGYIAGSKELIELLKYHAPGFVYSVGITPMNAAAAISSLELLLKCKDHTTRLQSISKYLWNQLKSKGFNVGYSIGTGIIPVIIGGSRKTAQLSDALFKMYKININPIIYPAVEENRARLRLFLNCDHTKEQIDYLIAALLKHA